MKTASMVLLVGVGALACEEESQWPEADCSSEMTLRYKLVEACPERCTLRSTWVLGQSLHYVCDCGQELREGSRRGASLAPARGPHQAAWC